jgi:hypothetical protein
MRPSAIEESDSVHAQCPLSVRSQPRTNLMVPTVQHVAKLHHHCVATTPPHFIVLCHLDHFGSAQRFNGLAPVPMEVTNCKPSSTSEATTY